MLGGLGLRTKFAVGRDSSSGGILSKEGDSKARVAWDWLAFSSLNIILVLLTIRSLPPFPV